MCVINKDRKRFIGLKLTGAKTPNTWISVLDFFENKDRLFVVKSIRFNKKTKFIDAQLIEVLKKTNNEFKSIIISNAPLSLPPCVTCNTKCNGFENCLNPAVQYMFNKDKKTPYSQRACDVWLKTQNPNINVETLGSNLAPITTRMHYLLKNLKGLTFFESSINASLFSILESLDLPTNYRLQYKAILIGARIRKRIIDALLNHIFIYINDYDDIIKNINLFDAFILSLCGYFQYKNKTNNYKKMIIPKGDLFIQNISR